LWGKKSWSKATQKIDNDATASQLQISNFKMQNDGTDTERSGCEADVWGKKSWSKSGQGRDCVAIAPQASPSGANIKFQNAK